MFSSNNAKCTVSPGGGQTTEVRTFPEERNCKVTFWGKFII